MHRTFFLEFLLETNVDDSGKASSYVAALEHLGSMLRICSFGFADCIDIYSVESVDRLSELSELVKREKREGKGSVWLSKEVPSSYLLKGFCSAAIRSYQGYLNSRDQEELLFSEFQTHVGSVEQLVSKLNIWPEGAIDIGENLADAAGLEVLRSVKVRLNQRVFRSMILNIYRNSCCICGLNIPQLNVASHIIPWAEDTQKRLDPTNGLCLSATYDQAFDRNLIGFDDEYRLVLSKGIRDYYPNEAVVKYFQAIEGQKIALPTKYPPSLKYLARHRDSGDF